MYYLAIQIILFVAVFDGCAQIFVKSQTQDYGIELKLYTKNNSRPYEIKMDNIADIEFDIDSPFEILIHGYSPNTHLHVIESMKNKLLQNGCRNVLTVDWDLDFLISRNKNISSKLYKGQKSLKLSLTHYRALDIERNECNIIHDDLKDIIWRFISFPSYKRAVANVPKVGEYVANILILLNVTKKLKMENIRIRGFSLGAHVAGFTGKAIKSKTGEKIGRISGLDPAGPLFQNAVAEKRLDKDDAIFTDVIHTNGLLLGIRKPIGHANFYPNGGCSQNCLLKRTIIDQLFCSHLRAPEYFTESIESDKFVSTLCDSYKNFRGGSCNNGQKVSMGYQLDTAIASGKYYLNINKESPYAQG